MLQGFYFESSAFSRNSFTIDVFIHPLYIPDESIALTFGNRLSLIAKGCDIWWEYEKTREKEISQEILSMTANAGLPFLEKRNSIEKLLRQYKGIKVNENKYIVEAVAYAHILVDEYKKSENMLRSFDIILSHDIQQNPDIIWMNDIQNRVQMILGYLQNQEYDVAKQKLNEWRNITLSNFGLYEDNDQN